MGRTGIGLHEVAGACAALCREGRSFGPTNVRLELGTGSYGTIVEHLRRLALIDPRRRPSRWSAGRRGRT